MHFCTLPHVLDLQYNSVVTAESIKTKMITMSLFTLLTMPDFASSALWMSLLTLTFLEIVLGVDNIIFISIASSKLPKEQQKKATNIGLILAMALRIVLLLFISVLIAMKDPWWSIDTSWLKAGFSGQSIILVLGGIFLLYKSVSEIHHKLEDDEHLDGASGGKKKTTLKNAIVQITLINIVFSFDSILTAVGMTNGLEGALVVMVRFMLIIEGGHLAHLEIFGSQIGAVPKGYLYFAIAFSLIVEFLNMKIRGRKKKVKLNTASQESASDGGILADENA